MICSLQELGIESKLVAKEFSEGIFVFPNDVEVGEDALEMLNRDDHILELGLTPNRADCLSMLGVAYFHPRRQPNQLKKLLTISL
ncbi:phenylalanyl-tRNA synthetase subunit beta [Mycobacteroides abscessus subsp. abscessus]|nr:phenylalanyl-tRNA synthetase subunit beta [Mycobacteroides abscessus subsp. abscessus]